MNRIKRFWVLGKCIEFANIADIKLANELDFQYDKPPGKFDGNYEILNGSLLAIFTVDAKNYLLLDDRLIDLTKNISIRYRVAHDMNGISMLSVYDMGGLIYELEFVNPHEPVIMPPPFDAFEDYEASNFACELDKYIKRVQKDPNVILFPEF